MIEYWIWIDNLRPFVETIVYLAGCELADDELDVITDGVASSDGCATPEIWFDWTFQGEHKIPFRLAHDQGSNVVQVKVDAPADVAEKVEMVVYLMNVYHVRENA